MTRDLELDPVMVRVLVLLADAHHALGRELVPERVGIDLPAVVGVEHAVRQRRVFDAAMFRLRRFDRPAVAAGARGEEHEPTQHRAHATMLHHSAVDLPYLTAELPGTGGVLRAQ